jgi:DNA-binding NtrC family response regulator
LKLPPLRERPEDIPALAELFLARYLAAEKGVSKRLNRAALKSLVQHKWPGNIRELENVIVRAAILCPEEEISPDYLFLR